MKNEIKKQALIKEIALELKDLTQESGEEEILALLNNESEMPFGAWVVECADWHNTLKELAKEEDIEKIVFKSPLKRFSFWVVC